MDERKIRFTCKIDPRLSTCIKVDLLRLRQILSNLIDNASKFTPEGGKIVFYLKYLKSDANEMQIRLGVKDSGIGIPKEKQQRIFEPFSQADNSTTREFGGTGLGLSICRHLVSLMGSQLKLKSVSGKGSESYNFV